jgi:hypothetical protein
LPTPKVCAPSHAALPRRATFRPIVAATEDLTARNAPRKSFIFGCRSHIGRFRAATSRLLAHLIIGWLTAHGPERGDASGCRYCRETLPMNFGIAAPSKARCSMRAALCLCAHEKHYISCMRTSTTHRSRPGATPPSGPPDLPPGRAFAALPIGVLALVVALVGPIGGLQGRLDDAGDARRHLCPEV